MMFSVCGMRPRLPESLLQKQLVWNAVFRIQLDFYRRLLRPQRTAWVTTAQAMTRLFVELSKALNCQCHDRGFSSHVNLLTRFCSRSSASSASIFNANKAARRGKRIIAFYEKWRRSGRFSFKGSEVALPFEVPPGSGSRWRRKYRCAHIKSSRNLQQSESKFKLQKLALLPFFAWHAKINQFLSKAA